MTNTAKIAYVQWPDQLIPHGPQWESIAEAVSAAKADILVTNEMPFGKWLPASDKYDSTDAQQWVELHEEALPALFKLDVKAVISSRPILADGKLINEAYVITDGKYKAVHHKKFFPEEAGWYEASWFGRGNDGFEIFEVGPVKVGVLLCTELFFNEHARAYGHDGVDVIVSPRATGPEHFEWKAAGTFASIISGAYVISSNRTAPHGTSPDVSQFAGHGFAISAGGQEIGTTSDDEPIQIVEIDLSVSRSLKHEYPCYVRELTQSL